MKTTKGTTQIPNRLPLHKDPKLNRKFAKDRKKDTATYFAKKRKEQDRLTKKTFREYVEEMLGRNLYEASPEDEERTKAVKNVLRQTEKERAKRQGVKSKPMWWEK